MRKVSLNKFYLYSHCYPNGKVFYVGVGKLNRPYEIRKSGRSKEWLDITTSLEYYEINVYGEFDTLKGAYEAEVKLIKELREQKHPLINKTGGGKGCKGLSPWNAGKTGVFSKETLKKLSKANKRRFSKDEDKEQHSIKTGGKLFAAYRDGVEIWRGINQSQCARDLNINQGNLSKCLHGTAATHKGLTFKFLRKE